MISPTLKRLHELAWFAGAHMHASWWAHLGIEWCRAVYATSTYCRGRIDRAIAIRRGFPVAPLDTAISAAAQLLLANEERLASLVTAVGLAALRRPEYLLMAGYRSALVPFLSARDCDQMVALARVPGQACAHVPAGRIAQESQRWGLAWLGRDFRRDNAWQALQVLLPAPQWQPLSDRELPQADALQTLVRVGRML